MSTRIQVDARAALAGLREARALLRVEVPAATYKAGAITQTIVRANASSGTHAPGRPHLDGTGPGPNVATGDYRRSITVTNHAGPGEATSDVSTAAMQGARLEFGFIGKDALGRYYRQPPFPHWAPAEAAAAPLVEAMYEKAATAIGGALDGT